MRVCSESSASQKASLKHFPRWNRACLDEDMRVAAVGARVWAPPLGEASAVGLISWITLNRSLKQMSDVAMLHVKGSNRKRAYWWTKSLRSAELPSDAGGDTPQLEDEPCRKWWYALARTFASRAGLCARPSEEPSLVPERSF